MGAGPVRRDSPCSTRRRAARKAARTRRRLSSSTSPRRAPDAGWPSSFGQVADVAFEPDGRHAWVFHRGSRIWTADSFDGGALRRVTRDAPIPENTVARVCLTSGKITRTFGAGEHYMPHGLTLGPDGDVWIVDAGLHQVIRYDAETGERVAAYGAKLEPGRGADGFCMPTDVAVAEDNSFWVADGYCASRIARFDASGAYVGEWSEGETNEASTNASSYATSSYSATPSYSTPHAVALDSCRSRLFVADRERARVVVHRADGGVVGAHDLSAHGKVYGLAVLRSEDQGMHGFYALCWRRGPDGRSGAVRLVARWFAGGANGVGTTAHWDLPGVTAPHMLDVVSGGVGGTAALGRGISLLVAETRPNVGDANLRRAWLGDGGGARDRERTHRGDDDTRHLVVAPARGWTPDSEPAVDVPALGSRRETAEAAKATKIAERASEPSIASAGDADTDARSRRRRRRRRRGPGSSSRRNTAAGWWYYLGVVGGGTRVDGRRGRDDRGCCRRRRRRRWWWRARSRGRRARGGDGDRAV